MTYLLDISLADIVTACKTTMPPWLPLETSDNMRNTQPL